MRKRNEYGVTDHNRLEELRRRDRIYVEFMKTYDQFRTSLKSHEIVSNIQNAMLHNECFDLIRQTHPWHMINIHITFRVLSILPHIAEQVKLYVTANYVPSKTASNSNMDLNSSWIPLRFESFCALVIEIEILLYSNATSFDAYASKETLTPRIMTILNDKYGSYVAQLKVT
jgi:hypothetical protein